MSKALFFMLTLLAFFFSACQTKQVSIQHKIPKACEYYSLKSAQCKDISQMAQEIEPYKVIFIGDHHSEDNLHAKIAALIQMLSGSGMKIKLANEWFYPSDNKILQEYVSQDINESEFLEKIQWSKRLKYYKFDSFKPMYKAIQNTQGNLYGVNLSRQERKRISDTNLSAMTQEERHFYHQLDTNVTAHKTMLSPFFAHCHAPKKNESLDQCSQRMYKVQVAWDTKMALEAYKLSNTLQDNEKLIVFAGEMHIQNNLGIPLRFSRLSALPYLSITPVENTKHLIKHTPSDFLLFYQGSQVQK